MKKNKTTEVKSKQALPSEISHSPEQLLLPAEIDLPEVKEVITNEELTKIKTLQSKALYAATLAEKAYSEARVAELEAHNFTLTIYNKYKLVSGKDSITNDGTILRAE